MAVLLLVRHGTTETTGKRLGGRTRTPLDERGRAQAEAAADRLADVELAGVWSSPITRTMQTARPIAARHDTAVRRLAGVQEVEYGEWTDSSLKQLRRRKLWSVIQQTPSRVTFPGGESIRGVQARAVEAVDGLVDELDEEARAVVVSHADVIKLLVAHYAGVPLDLFQRLVIGPASLTTLVVPKGGMPVLVGLNDTSHLPTQKG